jgi:hypothetical protein
MAMPPGNRLPELPRAYLSASRAPPYSPFAPHQAYMPPRALAACATKLDRRRRAIAAARAPPPFAKLLSPSRSLLLRIYELILVPNRTRRLPCTPIELAVAAR